MSMQYKFHIDDRKPAVNETTCHPASSAATGALHNTGKRAPIAIDSKCPARRDGFNRVGIFRCIGGSDHGIGTKSAAIMNVHERDRSVTINAVMAAGVIPSIREAWPMEVG